MATASTTTFQVLDGDADMCTSSAYFQFTSSLFDLSGMTNFDETLFMSRALRTRMSWGNISNPFSMPVWIFTSASLLSLTLYFIIAYKVYSSNHLMPHFLYEYEPNPSNFLLYTCFKFSEQEPLPWFIRRWTSGRLITLLWAVLSFFMISAYNSNLRAHMITAEYEYPIDTLRDVVDYAEKVWIYDVAATSRQCIISLSLHKTVIVIAKNCRKEYLSAIGMEDSVHYEIAVLAEKTDGWYSVNLGSRGLGGIDLRVPDVSIKCCWTLMHFVNNKTFFQFCRTSKFKDQCS